MPADIANFWILFLIGNIINILSDELGLGESGGANKMSSIYKRDILVELDESGYAWVRVKFERFRALTLEYARIGYNDLAMAGNVVGALSSQKSPASIRHQGNV